MEIYYGNKNIPENTLVQKRLTERSAPAFQLHNKKPGVWYTLVMYDPDAPNGMGKNNNKVFLHWLVDNITFDNTTGKVASARTLVGYVPPSPPAGTHRYIVEVYELLKKQTQQFHMDQQRMDFKLQVFKNYYGLRKKVATRMFRVAAESAV